MLAEVESSKRVPTQQTWLTFLWQVNAQSFYYNWHSADKNEGDSEDDDDFTGSVNKSRNRKHGRNGEHEQTGKITWRNYAAW